MKIVNSLGNVLRKGIAGSYDRRKCYIYILTIIENKVFKSPDIIVKLYISPFNFSFFLYFVICHPNASAVSNGKSGVNLIGILL